MATLSVALIAPTVAAAQQAPPVAVVAPPDPDAPRNAVVPPPGGEVRIVIPVAMASVAGLPDCSSSVATHCVLSGRNPSR